MQVNDYMNGGSNNLDDLLKQSFLDLDQNNPANDHLFDETSKDVFSKDWPANISKSKEARFAGKTGSAAKWIWISGGIAAVAALTTLAVHYYPFSSNIENKTSQNNIRAEKISPLNLSNNETNEKIADLHSQNETNAEKIETGNAGSTSQSLHNGAKLNEIPENTTKPIIVTSGSSQSTNIGGANETVETKNVSSHEAKTEIAAGSLLEKAFGITNEEAIKMLAETVTEKEKLIREATLNLFANYKHMPGTSSSAGTGSAMASDYFIKTSEISVREYKTFLQDLLLNGKLDEYEIARPKHREKLSASEQASERAIFDKYFTSPVYKNYPMVFISVDGANMYCEWLQNLIVATGNIKFQNAKVDLPRAQEWTLAALSENKNAEYATADGHLKQSKFLGMVAGSAQANYRETQKAAFSFMYNQNPFDLSPNTDSLLAKKNSASADDKTNFFTCPVRGVYLATQGGMYHMSGNVSEMIRNDNRSYSAKGGNWHSSAEYLQISWKEPEFRGELQPSPYIGFRPIIKGIRK